MKICSSWCTKSASTRLLCIMIPFILVSIFFAFGNSKNSSFSTSTWLFSSGKNYSGGGEQPELVAVAVNGGADREEAILEDYKFNSNNSFSPLTAEANQESEEQIQENQQPQVLIQKNETINISLENQHELPYLNETHALPIEPKIKKKFTNLEKLEVRLGKARSAIKEAATSGNQTDDPDYVPSGPMYWNAKAFHRSYLEMEKQFKVFVYEEGEQPIFHNGPCKSIYAMEGNFIYQMETTKFRTRDPEKAHVFFLPISVTAIVHFIYDRNSREHWNPMKQTLTDYINLVSGKYPYWNRSLGADHFLLACHDWGPEISKAVPELFKNSIRALCNANTSEGFKPSKDVSFPEILLPGGTMDGLIGGPSPSRRSILAFFAGGLHGPIRPILLEHWENKDNDIQVHRYLPKGVSYYGMLRNSKFCLCPSGYEVASPRMVEALYTGCVPVLLKDHYVPPFSDVLNWKSFSVEVPVDRIPDLKKILAGISTRQYIRLQRRGKTQLINHFLVNKSWYIVDLPGYGFANASEAARMDWSSFTKGYFLNRDTLVSVLLLIDASVPPQKIDLDCANWLGRNNIPITFVFTKCDKMKGGKAKRPDQNIRDFQELIRQNYKHQPPWIMTSSVSGLGRDELLLHMSQLRNYWNNE